MEITYDDLITGEKFYKVADFQFSSDRVEHGHEDYNKLENTFDPKKLKEVNVVYLHTMYKDQFFELIRPLDVKFIVVTHNSDINIDSTENLPENVIRWFSQNVNVCDPRLASLPIGLENDRWLAELRKKQKILEKRHKEKQIRNLVYVNHTVERNKKERNKVYKILKKKKWATLKKGYNGYEFDQYIDDIHSHKFVICPQGNGIDTHRKWETLYLDSIPIEKRCINSLFYKELPICLVDDWEEVTEDFLNREYERIKRWKWKLDLLRIDYWVRRIRLPLVL